MLTPYYQLVLLTILSFLAFGKVGLAMPLEPPVKQSTIDTLAPKKTKISRRERRKAKKMARRAARKEAGSYGTGRVFLIITLICSILMLIFIGIFEIDVLFSVFAFICGLLGSIFALRRRKDNNKDLNYYAGVAALLVGLAQMAAALLLFSTWALIYYGLLSLGFWLVSYFLFK